MLEHLFGSKTRVKLLNLFLRTPDEPIFVREITRRLDVQINAIRRELANLLLLGLIIERTDVLPSPEEPATPAGVKRKYYQLNAQCPLLPEIRALMFKSKLMLERRLDQEILALGDVRYLAFLGLFLHTQGAPVDIFVVGQVNQQEMKRIVNETERDLGCTINFSIMSPDEYRYRKEMTDRFLFSILESPKNVVLDRLGERG